MTNLTLKAAPTADAITFRKPRKTDGADIWRLINGTGKLDVNSMYCNLLQCDHFADTCILAEMDGAIVGWISGYLPPDDNRTFFVWQVAVDEAARGRGVAKKMLTKLMRRPGVHQVRRMQTTITKDNAASWALFRSFARDSGGEMDDEPHFRAEDHFDGAHDTEHLVTIRFPEVVRIAFAA
jgi:L-2,4-diaminobutyric acid acetyltransferase